jgi:hypothetical protein
VANNNVKYGPQCRESCPVQAIHDNGDKNILLKKISEGKIVIYLVYSGHTIGKDIHTLPGRRRGNYPTK